jgi:two-component system nitrate/nitrite response regulator NarL
MNNGLLKRPANDSSPPSTSDASKHLPKPVEVLSDNKQIEGSVPPDAIAHHANSVDVPHIDRLIGKSINRRTHGAARHGK